MDSKDKAKHYLRLTEGSEEGKPEGTPREYVEMRIRDGQKDPEYPEMRDLVALKLQAQQKFMNIEKIEASLDRRSAGDAYRGEAGVKFLLDEIQREEKELGAILKRIIAIEERNG